MTDLPPSSPTPAATFVVRSGDDETACYCDRCGAGIPFGVTCYIVPIGESDHGVPIVQVVCAACHD